MKIGDVDRLFWTRDFLVIGVDEVGRGSLAGPVTAGAVLLNPNHLPEGINDSKKISPAKRERLSGEIQRHALGVAVYSVSHRRIDEVGIKPATLEAMRGAVRNLYHAAHILLAGGVQAIILVDGLDEIPNLRGYAKQRAIVKGDSLSLSIAAASILAKVNRDRFMCLIAERYPFYGLVKSKGYGTVGHIKALRKHGPSPIHRRRFIEKILKET